MRAINELKMEWRGKNKTLKPISEQAAGVESHADGESWLQKSEV